jgi:hypothetical protein
MTAQERDYEAILSRVLHTTTDQLEPVGDGLTKIRARLDEPWLRRQWWLVRSGFMALGWLVVVRYEAFFSTVKSGKPGSAGTDSAAGPLAPLLACATPDTEEHGRRRTSLRPVLGGIAAWASGRRSHRPAGQAMAWLRPALAVAGAVVLVVAGVFALGQIRQGLFLGLENASGTNGSNSGNPGGNGNPYGGGTTLKNSSSPSLGRSGVAKPGSTTAHGRILPSPSPCSAASSPPINSPSPSPSPTSPSPTPSPTSPSPTPSPTSPSPSPSTSQAPITSGIAGHSQEAIGTTALVMCEPTAPTSPTNQAPGP